MLNHKSNKTMARTINTTTATIITRTASVDKFLADARQYPVLTAEEQTALAVRAKQGDVKAQNDLINCNLRFIFSVASKFAKGDEVLDLVSAATIGAIEAIQSFDESLGTTFLSYAVHYMRLGISEYFAMDAQLVRNKGNRLVTRANALSGKFYAEEGRYPTEDELIEMIEAEHGIEVKNRLAILNHNYASLSAKIDEDGTTAEEVGEIAVVTSSRNEYEGEMDAEENSYKVAKLLSTLPEKMRTILEMSFGIGYENAFDDDAISEKLCCSAERVRQLKIKALASLRERGARVLAM